jgi:hypothetical protein
MAVWYSLWSFGTYIFPFWNVWTEKNLATLLHACACSNALNLIRFAF